MKHLFTLFLVLSNFFVFAEPIIETPSDVLICQGTFSVNLNAKIPEILGSLNPEDHTVLFYNSLLDAESNTNAITAPTAYLIINLPEVIYVRVHANTNVNDAAFTNFSLLTANVFYTQPSNMIFYDSPFDGFGSFDFNQQTGLILQSSNDLFTSYYETQSDALNGVNPINTDSPYMNITNPQMIYVRVENAFGCFETSVFTLLVTETPADFINFPDANFKIKLISLGHDTNSDGEIQYTEATAISSLDVSASNISSLGGIEYFTNLETLNCGANSLASVDLSQNSALIYLNCSLNQLTFLDLTALENLETLYCSNNNLVDLDCSSNYNLTAIGFVNNPLETINIKNGSDESSNMDSGSWWENWSDFNSSNLTYVCADEFQVENINSIVNTANTNVNSFCTLGLANNANVLNVSVKFDSNNNGCEDQDVQIPYFGFVVNDVPNTTESLMFTNNLGQFIFFSNLATDYEVTPWIENPSYFNVSPATNSVNFPSTTNNQESLTFCVTANGIYQDLEVIIVPIVPARPGFEAVYKITYRNKGNQTINTENAVTFSYNDDLLDFVEASIAPETNTTGMLSWVYNDLKPFEVKSIEITLYVNPPTDPDFPVNIDDQLTFSATITPSGTADETPDDNAVTFNQFVIGSYDPNNIICLQGETAPVDLIGDYLYYVINFENTGNSEAVNILVNSLINGSYYDINSLRVIESSHNVNTKIENNQVDFYFENIYLEGGGHGNILLKMATNPGLQVNDFVESKANIYFDYNFPILTNDATTTFAVLSADNFDPINAFKMYPNPVDDKLFIQALETIKSVELYDQMGRLISVKLPNDSEIEMDLTQQTPGVYFVKITTHSYSKTEKLLIK